MEQEGERMNDFIRKKDVLSTLCYALCKMRNESGKPCEWPCPEYTQFANIPAEDVVEVVRCRDCKYRLEDNFCTGRGWPKQMVADDGFCEKGKRKDGDGRGEEK